MSKPEDRLSPDQRWAILEALFSKKQSVTDVAAEHGVHRTTVYDIRRQAESILKDTWAAQGPGRPAAGVPRTYGELRTLVQQQQQELRELRRGLEDQAHEGALKDVRIDFLEFAVDLHKKRGPNPSSARRRKSK